MATLFLETPDATQATQWWTTITGSVTYDTSQKKSGLASWKCDSGVGDAAAYLAKTCGLADAGGRISFYLYLDDLPGALLKIMQISTDPSRWLPSLYITSGGVLQYHSGAGQVQGSTLNTDTWYRICLAYTAASRTVNETRVFLDGNLDITASDISWGISGVAGEALLGWFTAPGANKVLNLSHVYVDDDTSLTDPGGGDSLRVTAKLPAAVNDNNYDTTGGTGAVNERPISETNYMMHAGKSAVLQDWTLQTAAVGDVDISGDTLVARCAWMWSMHSKAADTYFIVDDGDSTTTSWSDQIVATLNSVITDSATYPSNAAGIGQKSGAGAEDDYLYECGTMIAYIVAAAGDTFYQSVGGGITPTGGLVRMTSKFPGGGISPSGAVALRLELFRTYTGGITPGGVLVRKTSKFFDGTLGSSGALGTVWTKVLALAGAITPSGALIKMTSKFPSGAITPSGALATYSQFFRSLVGSITPGGTLVKMTSKLLAGSITPTGALAAGLLLLKSLAGTLTSSGAVVKKTFKGFVGTLTSSGALVKKTSKFPSGDITPTGVLGNVLTAARSLAGTVSSSGLLGTVYTAGTIIRRFLSLLGVGR